MRIEEGRRSNLRVDGGQQRGPQPHPPLELPHPHPLPRPRPRPRPRGGRGQPAGDERAVEPGDVRRRGVGGAVGGRRAAGEGAAVGGRALEGVRVQGELRARCWSGSGRILVKY